LGCKIEDDIEWSKACESVETVATSWMNWKAAVGEFGHHYATSARFRCQA